MIYFEIQLDGRVNVFDMSDALFLFRAQIEAAAEALPVPRYLDTAQEYIGSRCHQFESFDDMDGAQAWADRYGGFRAGEVRAALGRYQSRKAEAFLISQSDNIDCGQTHNGRTATYG